MKGLVRILKLNIAICDDDKIDIERLTNILESYYIARDIDLTIDTFTTGKELFNSYKNVNDYQILLLDVEMPSMDGIQIAEVVRSTIDKHVIIVFISNYPQYMQDSFRVHPFYYITKPITMNSIYELMDNIVTEITDSHIIYSLISTEKGDITINIRDVLYIEVINSKTGILNFHFKDKIITTKGTLSYWKEELQHYNFYQCYRSILLNLTHIHYFKKHSITLDNGEELPIGRSSEKELKDLYLNHAVKLINL
jgi:DNA-binding LytR/AlgR family response regulator